MSSARMAALAKLALHARAVSVPLTHVAAQTGTVQCALPRTAAQAASTAFRGLEQQPARAARVHACAGGASVHASGNASSASGARQACQLIRTPVRDAQPPALLQAWQQQGHHIPGNFWGQVSNLRTSAQSPAAGTVLARPPSRFSGISSSRGFQMYNVPVWQQLNSIQPDHVIYAIMGVNIAVFGLWQMFPRSEIMFKNFVCSRYHLGRGYVHTMLTSSISQQTLGHLFSNMFTFYFFGTSLLHAIGTVRFLQLYAGAAVMASAAQCMYDKRSSFFGASGAVQAMVIMSVCLNPFATYLVMGVIPAPAWLVGLGFIAYDFYGARQALGGTAWAGHLGGSATGVLAYYALMSRVW